MNAPEQIRALGDELRTRGSMLRSTAEAWLVRHYKVDASKATELIDAGSPGLFVIEEDALYPAKENPVIKSKKLDGVAAKPTSSQGASPNSKRNPAPAKKTTTTTTTKTTPRKGGGSHIETTRDVKRSGSKSGGQTKTPPSTQERSPMAAKKKAAKKSGAAKKPAAKKTKKRHLSEVQKKKMQAGRRKAAKARAAAATHKPKTWGEMGGYPAPKAPKKAKTRKAKAKTTSRKPKAKTRTRTVVKQGPPGKRGPAGKTITRKTRTTTKTTPRKGGGSHTETTRDVMASRSRKNPINDAKHMTVGIVAIAFGFGTAEVLDRLTVAMVNAPKDKDGKPIKTTGADGKEVEITRLTGFSALVMRHTVPTWHRFAVSGGGALVLGTGAFLLRKKSAWATTILGGLAVGFAFKVAGLGVSYLLPKVLPVEKSDEDTWVNEVFPENYKAFDLSTSNTASATLLAAAENGRGSLGGTPAWRRNRIPETSSASARDFGPSASGQAGKTACACGCGHEQGTPCRCPKGPTPQAPVVQREPAARPGSVVEMTSPAAGQTGGIPANWQTPAPAAAPEKSNVTKISERKSLVDLFNEEPPANPG